MRALIVVALLMTGCGGSSDASPEADNHPFAMPVTTPVRAGKHVMDELDRQQAERDRRNADLESLLQPRDE